MLSDLGSLASIIGLIVAFFTGFGVCKFTSKKNIQWNKIFSFIHVGNNNQNNDSKQ